MDQGALSILEALLKTNRPPTDQETAIIRESMALLNAKLKIVQAQISDTVAHTQALKAQVKQEETKLQRLREEEAAISETFADHRRVLSPFRNIPRDVLREICIACVENDMPTLSYRGSDPLPYVLAQISSGMRDIALTTPHIWTSMNVEIGNFYIRSPEEDEKAYSILARKAGEWLERAGGLSLNVFIQDRLGYTVNTGFEDPDYGPSNILFDTLLKYSTRWKELRFISRWEDVLPTPWIRIAALTAVDLPLLQSISLRLDGVIELPGFRDSALLAIPTLKDVKLEIHAIQIFTVNWAILTSLTVHGASHYCDFFKSEMARILQQTKHLIFCDIVVTWDHPAEHYSDKISLPYLKTFIVNESLWDASQTASSSILDLIIAPILEIFHIRDNFFDLSLSDFFKRSPHIRELSLPYFRNSKSLMAITKLLRHCPSLTVLSLWPEIGSENHDANQFLQAFVEEGDAGVICPILQHFNFRGNIDLSIQTLRLFLEGRQKDIARLNALPWKRVVIVIMGIQATETCQQMLDLVSQKKAAGLDVEVKESV